MCFPHANVTAHKRSKRNGLRRRKGGIPSCSVLNARYLLAVFVLVGPRGLMFDELCSVLRMLAIAQICEVFCMNSTMKIPIFGKLTTPFAVCLSILAPVILLLGGELARVVGLRLFCGKSFRDSKHREYPYAEVAESHNCCAAYSNSEPVKIVVQWKIIFYGRCFNIRVFSDDSYISTSIAQGIV
jgi:hypothetical protein